MITATSCGISTLRMLPGWPHQKPKLPADGLPRNFAGPTEGHISILPEDRHTNDLLIFVCDARCQCALTIWKSASGTHDNFGANERTRRLRGPIRSTFEPARVARRAVRCFRRRRAAVATARIGACAGDALPVLRLDQ